MKIMIVGRKNDTGNYERYITNLPALPLTTLSPGEMVSCSALLLPGGGDITPAFFGQQNHGSKNIDTELDIIQFQALDFAVKNKLPVLGICKRMQVINVAFGGTLSQDLPAGDCHRYCGGDRYHSTSILDHSCLYRLYGANALVNSAHHQAIDRLGKGLKAIQWCDEDGCIEAIVHDTLPILGLQWHPERLDITQTTLSGGPVLSLFSTWIQQLKQAKQ